MNTYLIPVWDLKLNYFKRFALHLFDKITQLQATKCKISNAQAYNFLGKKIA